MIFGNIVDQRKVDIITDALPQNIISPTPEQQWEYWKTIGWRRIRNIAEPTPGYFVNEYSVQAVDDEQCDLAVQIEKDIAEWEAEEAARIEAERIAAAAPVYMPTGVEGPVMVLVNATGQGIGVIADGEDITTYIEHASPTPTPEERAALIAAARTGRQSLKSDLQIIKADIAATVDATQLLSGSDFSGAQRTCINAILKQLVDAERELKALRRVVSLIVKGGE